MYECMHAYMFVPWVALFKPNDHFIRPGLTISESTQLNTISDDYMRKLYQPP